MMPQTICTMYIIYTVYCIFVFICVYILFTAKNKTRCIILCMLYSADKIVYKMNSV